MEKARLFSLLVLLVCSLLLFAACSNGNGDSDSGNDIPKEPSNNSPTICETHTWDAGYTEYYPTCLSDGTHVYKCTICGTRKTESVSRTEHLFEDEWTRTDTHHWHNALCDCRFKNEKSDYGEHTWDEGRVDFEPNCTQYGSKTYTCTVCSAGRYESIELLGHTYSEEWSFSSGYHWHDSTCCNDNWSDRAAHTWDEGVVTTHPTCTENGVRTYGCTVCEAIKEESISKTGSAHSWSEEVTVIPPTCVDKGYTTHTCTLCGDTYEDNYTDTVAHTYTETVTPPTCVDKGYTTHTCTVCSDSYIDSYTNTLEHDYKTQVMSPTCTSQGYTRHYCMNGCKDEYNTDYTDTIPHTYKTVVKSPTCTSEGYTTYTCSVCKYTYNGDYTEKTEHNYKVETIAPTCIANGYDYYRCQNCIDYYYTNYVDILPHNYLETVTAPTCTNIGYTRFYCKDCTYQYTGNKTPELGHSYANLHCIRCNKKEYSYDLDYTLSSDETYYTISGMGDCKDTEVIIPTTHNGIPVKKIATSAFEGNTKIKSLLFMSGDTQLTIGTRAFFGCSSLTNIDCESILAEVGIAAFANCASLERIKLDYRNTVYISKGDCLINSNTGFLIAGCKNSVIPNDGSVLAIEEYAFYGCTGLTTITIPESVYFIGMYAFKDCTSLESAHFLSTTNWYRTTARSHALSRETALGGTENIYPSNSSYGPEYNANHLTVFTSWYLYRAIVEET